jgi:predicted XRE-type DNA-binding protein
MHSGDAYIHEEITENSSGRNYYGFSYWTRGWVAMTLRNMIEQLPKGGSILASARLRRQIVKSLNKALDDSGMSQSELARALGKSRSAVSQVLTGDGNLKIETVAEYLHEMGAELNVSIHFPSATREV